MRRLLACVATLGLLVALGSPVDAAPGTPAGPVAGAPTFGSIDVSKIDAQLRPFLLDPTRQATVMLELTGAPVSLVEAGAMNRGMILSSVESSAV